MPAGSVNGVLCKQEGFEEEAAVPLAKMEYGRVGQSYVLLTREPGSMTMGKLGACLQFTVKEIDPSTGAGSLSAACLAASFDAEIVGTTCFAELYGSLQASECKPGTSGHPPKTFLTPSGLDAPVTEHH